MDDMIIEYLFSIASPERNAQARPVTWPAGTSFQQKDKPANYINFVGIEDNKAGLSGMKVSVNMRSSMIYAIKAVAGEGPSGEAGL